MMNQPKKLIEVAMPIKEISAESVRDKNIKTGLPAVHQWWARRPLPVCRAVIFASLIPDPLDDNCPNVFKEIVEIILGSEKRPLIEQGFPSDPYKPYEDIPYTSAKDKMEDNLRNRLLMFIGKFSPIYYANEKVGIKTDAKDQLSNESLIKWDNKFNDLIVNKARKLIWAAFNIDEANQLSASEILSDFDTYYNSIKVAEQQLYSIKDRHIESAAVQSASTNLELAIEAFLEKMPKVFDPFAGGGAIPLEAARLGCRSFGNDINPVAHIIQKSSLEFPQKFGKPITLTTKEFIKLYGKEEYDRTTNDNLIFEKGEPIAVNISNRLAHDVDYYIRKMLNASEREVSELYPVDEDGIKPIAYYWSRTALCSNPSCKAEVPLLKQFYICNKKDKKIYLKPIIKGSNIEFQITKGTYDFEGWNNRGNLKCPCCGSITDVKKIKEQSRKGYLKQRLLAVIYDGKSTKEYRLPNSRDISAINNLPKNIEIPEDKMQRNSAGGDTFTWGYDEWGQMFSLRQLYSLQVLIANMNKIKSQLKPYENAYDKAIVTYLGLFIDKIVTFVTSFGRWDVKTELLKSPFSKQAIPMIFDFPETTIFNKSTVVHIRRLSI